MSDLKIVLTGPESTGKSTLALQLAEHFQGGVITEFARPYIAGLNRSYEYKDLELIAKRQIYELENFEFNSKNKIVFLDTFLIITKVWFEVVYKTCPEWIINEIGKSQVDLYLLCVPDLPWEKDEVRENGGEMREWLFKEYERNLIMFNFDYKKVDGLGSSRLDCAVKHVETLMSLKGVN